MMTLIEARRYVEANRDKGIECPCCGQFAKTYRRKLNVSMARGLIWLVNQCITDEWVDVPSTAPKWLLRSRELPKLSYWGLVEERPLYKKVEKRCSGFWRPTKRGVDFAYRRSRVPSHVFIYDNDVVGTSEVQIDIVTALGAKFSYAELMNAV